MVKNAVKKEVEQKFKEMGLEQQVKHLHKLIGSSIFADDKYNAVKRLLDTYQGTEILKNISKKLALLASNPGHSNPWDPVGFFINQLCERQLVNAIKIYDSIEGGDIVTSSFVDLVYFSRMNEKELRERSERITRPEVLRSIETADPERKSEILTRISRNRSIDNLLEPTELQILESDLKQKAESFLQEFRGYVYSLHRSAIKDFILGRYVMGPKYFEERLTAYRKRADELITAKIPSIFLEEFESRSEDGLMFPVLDSILLQGSGSKNYRLVNASNAIWHRENERDVRLPIATSKTIILFAQHAFDDGEINPQFVRDLQFKLGIFDNASDAKIPEYQENKLLAIEYLRTVLRDFIPEKTDYEKKYKPGMELKFLFNDSVWCVDFSPEDRIKIFNDFVERLKAEKFKGKVDNLSGTIERMKFLFPELSGLEESELRANKIRLRYEQIHLKYNKAISSGNYASIPQDIFLFPEYADLKNDFMKKAYDLLKEHRFDPALVENKISTNLANYLGLDPIAIHFPEISSIINSYRMEQFIKMTDGDFTKFIPDKFTALGYGMYRHGFRKGERTTKDPLHQYVMDRFKNLDLDNKTKLTDYAEQLAKILGDQHFDELIKFFHNLEEKTSQGLENYVSSVELPETVSKDPPFKLELSDGNTLWVKVRPTNSAKLTYIINKNLRESHSILAQGIVQSPVAPYELGNNSLVFYVNVKNSKPDDEVEHTIRTLAYMHFFGKIFYQHLPLLISPVKLKTGEEIEQALSEADDSNRRKIYSRLEAKSKRVRYELAVARMNQELSEDFTIIHGDMHRENIKDGVIIDDESFSIGHPYLDLSNLLWDVFEGKAENQDSVRTYFNHYLDFFKTASGLRLSDHDDRGWREREWQKFKFISSEIEMPWRIARVWKYEHLRVLEWRVNQREYLASMNEASQLS